MQNLQQDLETIGTGVASLFVDDPKFLEPEGVAPQKKEGEGSGLSLSPKEEEPELPQLSPEELEVDQSLETIKATPFHVPPIGTNMRLGDDYDGLATSPDSEPIIEEIDVDAHDSASFSSPEDFIERMYPAALEASRRLGVSPTFLIAQAAHETGWGKSVGKGGKSSSNNLFGIKADSRWKGKVANFDTHEYVDGKRVDMKEPFRAYKDYNESFLDYANFIKSNPRYKKAVKVAGSPSAYATELQKAGYATDPEYANKLMKIMSGVDRRAKKMGLTLN